MVKETEAQRIMREGAEGRTKAAADARQKAEDAAAEKAKAKNEAIEKQREENRKAQAKTDAALEESTTAYRERLEDNKAQAENRTKGLENINTPAEGTDVNDLL
jgi:membrane protein involved in colicin uptake